MGFLPREDSSIKSGQVFGPDVCPGLMSEFGSSWVSGVVHGAVNKGIFGSSLEVVGGVWEGLPGEDSFIKSGHALGPDVCPDLMNECDPFWLLVRCMGRGEGRYTTWQIVEGGGWGLGRAAK